MGIGVLGWCSGHNAAPTPQVDTHTAQTRGHTHPPENLLGNTGMLRHGGKKGEVTLTPGSSLLTAFTQEHPLSCPGMLTGI